MALMVGRETKLQFFSIFINGCCGSYGSSVLETLLDMHLGVSGGRSPRGYGRMAFMVGRETKLQIFQIS